MKNSLFGWVALAALLAIGCGSGAEKGAASGSEAKAEPVKLRLAHFPNLTHAPALVGVADGTFARALGAGATLDVKVVTAGPEAMEALLAGELDMSYVGPSPAINTFLKTRGRALQVVAGACSGGSSLVARGDVPISKIEDLAGKRVAVPQLGNTQDVSLRYFMSQKGLKSSDKGGSVTIMPIKNPDILTVLKRKEIDAAWVPEPWASRFVAETGAKRVLDERELWPDGKFPLTVLVASRKFIEAHPDLVAKMVAANSEIVAKLNADPTAGKKATNEALKKVAGKALPDALINEAWTRMEFVTDPIPSGFQKFAEAAQAAGYLKGSTDLTGLFAESAATPAATKK